MDPRPARFAPFARSAPACDACGLRHDDLSSVAGHVEHVAAGLPALEQRQLRSHLFALLAAISPTIAVAE
jgi:hypothetical protein